MRTRTLHRLAWLPLLAAAGCGEQLDITATYRCQWPETRACEEYIPVDTAQGLVHVEHAEAEQRCVDPESDPGDYGPGSFAQGNCGRGDALGRCVSRPGYLARRYYYTGFAGVTSPDDPGNDAIELTCDALAPTAVYERPPFSD